MRTIYHQHRFKNIPIILVIFLAVLFVGCSGYQSVSYYQDGIYGEVPLQDAPHQTVNTPQQSGTYYKNYFSEKASQGIQEDYIFTNPDQYQTPMPEQNSAGNYQAHGGWGDQTDNVNVNIIYNRPMGWNMGWGWYDAPYAFGRSSFWGYNYHPWYFTFGHYHNPYYNPYRFGWGHRSNYWNRWGYQNPYWDRYSNRNVYRNAPIYSRLNGSRAITRNSTPNRNGRNLNSNSATTNNRANARSATRTNTNAQRSSTTTTQQRQGVSTTNRTPSRTTTRRSNSTNSRATTSQSQNNSSRNYSDNNSSYRSSSSTSSNSYRRSTPSSSTRSTSSGSSRSSSGSSRRR